MHQMGITPIGRKRRVMMYDYWENLEHDFGLSEKEMAGIRKAAEQLATAVRIDELRELQEYYVADFADTGAGKRIDTYIELRIKELTKVNDLANTSPDTTSAAVKSAINNKPSTDKEGKE